MATEDERVSGNLADALADHLGPEMAERMMDLAAERDEPLHPDLLPYVGQGQWGPMLRHPLVYEVPLLVPGMANKAYEYKKKRTAEALADEDWHQYVFLHERAYRLRALIDVTGRYDWIDPSDPLSIIPIMKGASQEIMALVADVWVDSENIQQVNEEWRALLGLVATGETGQFIGTAEEKAALDALPDSIPAYRGGAVGDWSWTTDIKTAEFFSRRSDYPVREALIPKADCFGYLTRRNEFELLVRLTPERYLMVYPGGEG